MAWHELDLFFGKNASSCCASAGLPELDPAANRQKHDKHTTTVVTMEDPPVIYQIERFSAGIRPRGTPACHKLWGERIKLKNHCPTGSTTNAVV